MARYVFKRGYNGAGGSYIAGEPYELTDEEARYLMERFPGLIAPLSAGAPAESSAESKRTAKGGSTRILGRRSGSTRGVR